MNKKLSADLQLGHISVNVANLERSLNFYRDLLGFHVVEQTDTTAAIGTPDKALVVLNETPNATPLRRGQTGLFHFAVLMHNRVELAHILKRLIQFNILQGASDHNVSEALYFSDPDGNGIEIYADRPRESWQYEDNGDIVMQTLRLDLEDILNEIDLHDDSWTGLKPETTMGHMHLHVSHIEESVTFYRDVIGLDLMTRYGGQAAFLSAGGYHHHLGINTWAGVGAPPPPEHSIGINYWEMVLNSTDQPDELKARLKSASIDFSEDDNKLILDDPSGNTLHIIT